VVSRLTWQKGMDMLVGAVDGLVAAGGRLAVLGSGDAALEGAMLAAASRHRGKVGMVVGYDEPLSHLLQGGADAILIPSRFEPCGLTQLYGLRYGCVPVVARTGGLADTIIDANEAAFSAGVATGFQYQPSAPGGLDHAISRAVAAYARPADWSAMQRQGMKADVSWTKSAARYVELYRSLLNGVATA
jgi:starch synthase